MKILLSSQVRELDSRTISSAKASGFELMERAGAGAAQLAARFIKNFYPVFKKIIILTGKGNNGGDGFVAARYLADLGFDVSVFLITEPKNLKGDALEHFKILESKKNIFCEFRNNLSVNEFPRKSIIIDALLGTGLSGAPTGKFAEWIRIANESRLPLISLDIPSGLNSDTGEAYDPCIQAVLTITFGVPKRGLFEKDALSKTGILRFVDIGVPREFIEEYDSGLFTLTGPEAEAIYPRHPHDCHKYSKGVVTIIAGSKKFSGAAALAASSALAAGAGFVNLLYPEGCEIRNIPNSIVKIPLPSDSGTFSSASLTDDFFSAKEKSHAICLGPGIGLSENLYPIIGLIWNENNKKIVFDADALNLIAKKILPERSSEAILTPHEGEFKRLLDAYRINSDSESKIQLAKRLASITGSVVVLKGVRSIIVSPKGKVYLNPTGSSALASAGTGDVLAGMITSFCAQGMKPFDAAILGAYIHGRLAEISGRFNLDADELISLLKTTKPCELFSE